MRSLAFVVLAAGCGVNLSTSSPINPAPHGGHRDPASVEVYVAGPPPRARVDVSMTWADITGVSSDPFGEMLASLRKKAADDGCDALIVQRTGAQNMVATCSMWVDGPAGPPPAAPSAAQRPADRE